MRLDNATVDRISKEIDSYEKAVPGIRGGADYPEFALAMLGSEWFPSTVRATILMAMLEIVMIGPEARKALGNQDAAGALLDKIAENSPQRDTILRAAYLGYRLGKLSKEG